MIGFVKEKEVKVKDSTNDSLKRLYPTLSESYVFDSRNYVFDGTLHQIVFKIINYSFAQGLEFASEEDEKYFNLISNTIYDVCRMMLFYGVAFIVLKDGNDLNVPISSNIENLKLSVYTPEDLRYLEVNNDVNSYYYLEPISYQLQGQDVDLSRIIRFTYIKMPTISLAQNNKQYLSLSLLLGDILNAKNEVIRSLASGVRNLTTLNVGVDKYLEHLKTGEITAIKSFLEMFKDIRNNSSIILTDKESMEISNIEQTLSGLKDLYDIIIKQLGTDTGLGTLVLTGEKIKGQGLNSSNESEFDIFYNGIKAFQNSYLLKPLNYLMNKLGRGFVTFKNPKPITNLEVLDNEGKKVDIMTKASGLANIDEDKLKEVLDKVQ